MIRYVVGIDEVGRGPLAGPVAVGAFLMPTSLARGGFSRSHFSGLKDSKKLSEKHREQWVLKSKTFSIQFGCVNAVSFVSSEKIDSKGLSWAIKTALEKSLEKVCRGLEVKECKILLDGGLKAPAHFIHQTTIVKGDEKEVAIALASIVSKVSRDRRMKKWAKQHPEYGFEIHKGYGTAKHLAAIRKHGLSPIHRRSFLKRYIGKKDKVGRP